MPLLLGGSSKEQLPSLELEQSTSSSRSCEGQLILLLEGSTLGKRGQLPLLLGGSAEGKLPSLWAGPSPNPACRPCGGAGIPDVRAPVPASSARGGVGAAIASCGH